MNNVRLGQLWMGDTPPIAENMLWIKSPSDTSLPYSFMYCEDTGGKKTWKEWIKPELSALEARVASLETELGDLSGVLNEINGEVI